MSNSFPGNVQIDENGNLIFIYINVEDDSSFNDSSAPYMCTYVDPSFSTSFNGSQIYVEVINTESESKYEPVPLKIAEKQYSVETGDFLRLNCIHGGYPKPRILWYLNGTEVEEFRDYNAGFIWGFELKHGGEWSCNVENGIGKKLVHTFNIDVKQRLHFKESQNGNESYRFGENVELECLAEGEVSPSYEWLINSVPIADVKIDKRWNIKEDKITISNFQNTDLSVVCCRASIGSKSIYKEFILRQTDV